MKALKKLGITIGTAILFYFVLQLILKNQPLTLILTISVFLHECGHWLMMRSYGLRAGMIFIPPLGAAVYPDKEYKETFKSLPRLADVVISLAGPVVNIALAGVGLFIATTSENPKLGLAFASINASLALFNLLPVAIFDGGRYARALFASTNEEQDKQLAVIFSIIGLVVGGAMLITGKLDYYALMLVYGAQIYSRTDNPADAESPRSMNWTQSKRSAIIYIVLIAASWILVQSIPNWSQLMK